MRFASWIAAAGVAAMMGAGAAQAAPSDMIAGAPSATLQAAVDVGLAPQIELIRGGCGWGEHRGWYGRCHYNRGWRGHVRWRRNHWRWHHWY